MDGQRAESIREWDARPAGEGYEGLHRLSREEFSGAVEGGEAWALMTNGRVVGVVDGDIESFESASLTAHAAPDDALPLLFAMQERGGETRAKYYTEETPVSAADRTLSEGGFTGYLELSENVLSGDYYVVYHGGRSSSVAFVGANERLVTGEEAFEAADDEVGIYRIVDVDVTVTEIPGAPGEAADETPAGSGAEAAESATPDEAVTAEETGATGDATDAADRTAESPADGAAEPAPDARAAREQSAQSGPYSGGEEIRVGAGLEDDEPGEAAASGDAPEPTETDRAPSVERDAPGTAFEDGAGPAGETASDAPDEPATPADDPTPADPSDAPAGPDDGSIDASPAAESEPAGEDTAEPSDASADSPRAGAPTEPSAETPGEDVPPGDDDPDAVGAGASRAEPVAETESETGTADPDEVRELRATRDRLESELETVRERLSAVQAERDDALEETERLRERVEELEARLEGQTEVTPERSLSAEEALSGTNLFVRYDSKSDPTLEAAHRGDADREAVDANLDVERHTTFEAEGATVDGEPFDAFLSGTLEYRFVEWVIEDLLYELRATGNRGAMRGLYDLIPEIDRVELHGSVTSGEDNEEGRAFDVVFRDRMGNPLAVADLHDSRDPAEGAAVGTLIEDAKWVVESEPSLATAFHVTASYYDPPALERAANAVDSGFLSTSRHKSYVKLNRKRGFHLCLVEAREGAFGLNVPEL